MIYNVVIEGQTIPVPEEIGTSDEAVKRALTPFYPEAASAMITRVEKDGVTTISVVKRAGSKGMDFLVQCAGGKNPAVALYEEIEAQEREGALDPMQVLALDGKIDQALEEGEKQAKAVEYATKRLVQAAARPAPMVIQGF